MTGSATSRACRHRASGADRTPVPGTGGAWTLALLPPFLSALDRIPDALGAPLGVQATALLAGGLCYAALLRRDAAAVATACPAMPRGVSNMLVPLYLRRRATATGRGGPAAVAWFAALAVSLAVSPVRVRAPSPAGALPACDAPEIRAVMPGYAARDGGVRGVPVGAPVEVTSTPPSARLCVALLRDGDAMYSYAFTLALDGTDVIMSGTVEAVPGR